MNTLKNFDSAAATTDLDKRRADVRSRLADLIEDLRATDADWKEAGRYRRDDVLVEQIALDIAEGRKPKLPGKDKGAERYLLKDALTAAEGRLTRMITQTRIAAAADHREKTAPAYRAVQRERALLIARLRRLNGEAHAYVTSMKGAGPALAVERITTGNLLGTTKDAGHVCMAFINAAIADGLVTQKELSDA